MKKYKGNLEGSDFLKVLNKVMGIGTRHYDTICCFCHHHNGECVDYAKKGTCKAYDKNHEKCRSTLL